MGHQSEFQPDCWPSWYTCRCRWRYAVYKTFPFTHRLTPADVCVCIYDPRLVKAFSSKAPYNSEDKFIDQNFIRVDKSDTVAALDQRISKMSSSEACSELQKCLISSENGGSHKSKIGRYSNFHETAASAYGLDDPRTLRLAHMYEHDLTLAYCLAYRIWSSGSIIY